jgi:prephenate dehydrogenase
MVEGNAVPTAEALARIEAKLDLPWPDLIAEGNAVVTRQPVRRPVRIPVDRAALLALGRAGGAVTQRQAAFVEGWVPEGQ